MVFVPDFSSDLDFAKISTKIAIRFPRFSEYSLENSPIKNYTRKVDVLNVLTHEKLSKSVHWGSRSGGWKKHEFFENFWKIWCGFLHFLGNPRKICTTKKKYVKIQVLDVYSLEKLSKSVSGAPRTSIKRTIFFWTKKNHLKH